MDQLIAFIKPLPAEDQARVGLPWVANLVLADPNQILLQQHFDVFPVQGRFG
ncbi:hypothetical protein ACIBWG_32065 [Streptomyces griseoaurantiacus]|uniref:hypothetical protein n=1 Tax=Streptomyces griseoaurantiacus TaxID=68213 RepID=UPI0037AC6492